MKRILFSVILLSASTLGFIACNKDASTSHVNIRMTDAPGEWDQVNIDLKEVQLKLNSDSTHWVTLQTNASQLSLVWADAEIIHQVLVNLLKEKMLRVGAAFSLINFFLEKCHLLVK